tara:strand:+ start:1706 stop:2032 length:327 start_codon:yes stop_codon:yes gene_type:complete
MVRGYEFEIDKKRYRLSADKWNWIIARGNKNLNDADFDKSADYMYFSDFVNFSNKLFTIMSREEVKKRGFQHIIQIFSNTEAKLMKIYSHINGLDTKLEMGVKEPERG